MKRLLFATIMLLSFIACDDKDILVISLFYLSHEI